MRRLFHRCAARKNFILDDHMFDWTLKAMKQQKKKKKNRNSGNGEEEKKNTKRTSQSNKKITTKGKRVNENQKNTNSNVKGEDGGANEHNGNNGDNGDRTTTPNTSKEVSGAKGIRQRNSGENIEKKKTITQRAPTSGNLPPFLPPMVIKTTPTDAMGMGGQNAGMIGGAEILSSAGAHAPSSHSAGERIE